MAVEPAPGPDPIQRSDSVNRDVPAPVLRGWKRIAVTDTWLGVLVGVVVLSLLPDNNPVVALVPPIWADLAHIPAYALLTVLTILFVAGRMRVTVGVLAMIVASILLFGIAIEILQQLAGRTASVLDAIWNGIGAVLGAWGYFAWMTRRTAVRQVEEQIRSVDTMAEVASGVELVQLDAATAGEWDAYVDGKAQACLYHRAAWRETIYSVFGHESMYLCARRGGSIVGVLPLVRLRSRLFGDYMVSMPYFNYGGVLADSPAVSQELMTAAAQRASSQGCSHIEFRDTEARTPWAVRTDKVTMELPLPADPAALWSGFTPKLRAQVRKPQKEGAEFVRGGAELLPEFYQVFARNMRDLGTPVYSRRFFQTILETFPQQASIALVRYRHRPVAAGFLLGYRDRLEIPWASSLREFNRLGANMLLYAEVLRTAIENGYRTFDFGRSSLDSGTYKFKKQWGAAERQLYWHYWLAAGKELPRLNPDNPKYRMAIALWRRLPLFVANGLGPHIVKNLP